MASSSSSHLMKTTRRGRPYVKDTHDLFSTLIVSLRLSIHRQFFKTFPYSFNTDEACSNLASLKFSQSSRAADPKDPSRIITTTTTTTFSMSRDMAKGICQYFMDAHLIENGTDLFNNTFKDRGIYLITPKGLHILERFVTKNGILADYLKPTFTFQTVCSKLLHLERRSQDDEILITRSMMEIIFKRFAGKDPNITTLSEQDLIEFYGHRPHLKTVNPGEAEGLDKTNGCIMRKATVTDKKSSDKGSEEYVFSGRDALDWLCDFTTITGDDEAAEVAAHFVRYGFITLVSDRKSREGSSVVTVRAGGPGGGAGAKFTEAEFRCNEKAMYKVTPEGAKLARWGETKVLPGANASSRNLTTSPAVPAKPRGSESSDLPQPSLASIMDGKLSRRQSVSGHLGQDFIEKTVLVQTKDSHTAKLEMILGELALRSLFRDFLVSNFCEENLSFWVDVSDFKRRFNTTSSAIGSGSDKDRKSARTIGNAAVTKHQQDLIAMALVIYNTYLAPASPCELNIDHNMRAELVSYMHSIVTDTAKDGTIDPSGQGTIQASQLKIMMEMYERIQEYIFRLMATDSVPKFCKTERYTNLMRSVKEYNEKAQENDAAAAALASQTETISLNEKTSKPFERPPSPTKAYLTVSQAANEKQAMLMHQQISR